MTGKVLGKIDFAEYGLYPDRPFLMGLQLVFTFQGCGIGDGAKYTINMSKECKWESKKERQETITKYADNLYEILEQAKVNYVSQLKNIPVEIIMEDNMFKDFRILTEVL